MYVTFRGQARTHTNHSLFTTLRNPTHYWCAGHTTSEKGGQNFGGGAKRRNVRPPFSDWLNSATPCQRSCSWRRAKLSVSDSHRYALVTRPPTDFIRWIVLCPKKCFVMLPRRGYGHLKWRFFKSANECPVLPVGIIKREQNLSVKACLAVMASPALAAILFGVWC